ncbi:MAG TPA: sigma-70 family RNA polymerase sigma factor [Opitutaceae bacterium]|nr:sigma-70 family RNA polymerase sigma factor [Lacunisphaera sp.]HWA08702.1 sigma-70 family RNA polymerase sigma factor [Opitutaceae bacterium]
MIADASAPPDAVPSGEISACLRRVQAGDEVAARELVERSRPLVTRIVRRRLPRRDAEEDLVQEVFIKMFTRLGQYQGEAPFEHWLARIALRTCFDHLRAQRCRPELRWADLSLEQSIRCDAALADARQRPPGEALEAREIVDRILPELKPDDRRIVVYFHLEEMSLHDISRATGWDFEFVKMRLFRARGKLRRLIQTLSARDHLGYASPRSAGKVGNPKASHRTTEGVCSGIPSQAAA